MSSERGKIIRFEGVKGMDAYNPSIPFRTRKGRRLIAARIEKRSVFWRDKNYLPRTCFFTEIKENNSWRLVEELPTFHMEDPFVCFIDGEFVLGGVEVFKESGKHKFRTVFFKGKDVYNLKKVAAGPNMMKDIRLVELTDGKIGVFTRPQGGTYQRGRIGFTTISSLRELNNDSKIVNAAIIRNHFRENEWEGTNEARALEDGLVGVLAHNASIDKQGNKEYKATTFVFDSQKMEASESKVIAERKDFPETGAKCPKLKNIIFPSGLKKEKGGYDLYTGISDSTSGVIEEIKNPYSMD